MYDALEDARQARAFIDRLGCGGQCFGPPGHKIVDLDADQRAP
jgi:hypothetical protein